MFKECKHSWNYYNGTHSRYYRICRWCGEKKDGWGV